jgi:hypothetical protein
MCVAAYKRRLGSAWHRGAYPKQNIVEWHIPRGENTFNASRKWKAASSKQPTECAYCPLSISIVLSLHWRIVGKRVNQFFICTKAYRKKWQIDKR